MSIQQNLSPETIAVYHATAQKRLQQERLDLRQRREAAWQLAHQAAHLLRERFNVERVVVFGSLARGHGFTRWSDIDLAAWGIAPEDTFRAMGAVMDLGTNISVNLVDVNTVKPSLLATIERDGIDL